MKKKKIPAALFVSAKKHTEITFQAGNTGAPLEVTARTVLSPAELISFVASCMETAIIDNTYYDALFEYSFRANALEYLTDLNLPADGKNCEYLVFGNSCVYQLLQEQKELSDLLKELRTACQNARELELAQISHPKSAADRFLDTLLETTEQSKQKLQDVDIDELNRMLKTVSQVQEKDIAEAMVKVKEDSEPSQEPGDPNETG